MKRTVTHGYDKDGQFYITVVERIPGFTPTDESISLLRVECAKISKHMQFGKKGEERVIETVNGKEVA